MDDTNGNTASALKVLRLLRDAFTGAQTTANGLPDNECFQTMRGLCEKAGKALHLLIDGGGASPNGLPDTLLREPTMVGVVVEEDHDPPEHEEELLVHDLYWWAFLGWAGEQSDIPVTTTESITRNAFGAYDPGGNFDIHNSRLAPGIREACAAWPRVCRASVQAIEHLLELAGEGVDSSDADIPETTDTVQQVDGISNPSAPVSKKVAADAIGGDMSVKKLSSLMNSGMFRCEEFNRQTFIFDLDQIPGLPAPRTSPN